jgi:hypothetical protein
MKKITVTFQEDGQQPTVIEIPAEISAALDAHVAALEEATGQRIGGKAGLFARMTWDNWLKPVLTMRGVNLLSLAGDAGRAAMQARLQAQQAEAQADKAAMAAVIQIKNSPDGMQEPGPLD